MKVLFYDPQGYRTTSEMVRMLRDHGIKADDAHEMGYEDAEDVAALLRTGQDSEEYDVLICLPDASEIMNFLPRVLRHGGVKIPFIFLTAGDAAQRTTFLEQGASCCLARSVAPGELFAAIHAQHALYLHGTSEQVIRVGNVMLDLSAKRVSIVRDGDEGIFPVQLTGKEFSTLETLMRNAGRAVTKEQIMTNLYLSDTPEIKIIDVFVCKVRGKLRQAGADPIIETVWGRGYIATESFSADEGVAS